MRLAPLQIQCRRQRLNGQALLGQVHQLFESSRVSHCQVSQHLSVHVNAGLLQARYKLAVIYTHLAAGGADTDDPQTTEIAFAFPPVPVGMRPGVQKGLFGPFIVAVG